MTTDYPDEVTQEEIDKVLAIAKGIAEARKQMQTPAPRRNKRVCQFPKCPIQARHTHHLTYSPSVTTRLCKNHHKMITIVNCNAAQAFGRKLSNRERLTLWTDWIEGKVAPVYSAQAMAWVEKWH